MCQKTIAVKAASVQAKPGWMVRGLKTKAVETADRAVETASIQAKPASAG